jgi:hypothetical protein
MENRLMSAALMDVRFSETEERVVPFPLSGQASTIRRCARELENVHGDEALAVLENRVPCFGGTPEQSGHALKTPSATR